MKQFLSLGDNYALTKHTHAQYLRWVQKVQTRFRGLPYFLPTFSRLSPDVSRESIGAHPCRIREILRYFSDAPRIRRARWENNVGRKSGEESCVCTHAKVPARYGLGLALGLMVLVFVGPQCAAAQESFSVSGKVISATSGQAIEGATITNKRTRIHAVTDRAGEYRIQARPDDILTYTFVGYRTAEEEINGRQQITVALDPAENILEEVDVVSTGYQTIPKERATGSFVFVDSALLNRAVSTDIISRLKGVVPSLLFDERAGGEPKLSIRGRSTIYANADPLIVVDNFPYEGDIRNINPNDVESVSILRDAAAASIWGVRAGNGVIVITTKKGKAGQPLQVSVNGNVTVGEKPDLWYEPRISPADMVDVQEFLFGEGYYDAALRNTTTYPVIPQVVEILADPLLSDGAKADALGKYRSADLRRDITRHYLQPSVSQQYAINVSGGTASHSYALAGGVDRIRPHMVGNSTLRTNFSARQEVALSSRIKMGSAVNYTSGSSEMDNGFAQVRNLAPYTQLQDENGHPVAVPRDFRQSFAESAIEKGLLDWRYVPLNELGTGNHTGKSQHLRLQQNISANWYKGLSTRLLYQYETQLSEENQLESETRYFTRNLINRYSTVSADRITRNIPEGSYYLMDNKKVTSHNGRLLLSYQFTDDNHEFSAQVGYEIRQVTSEGNARFIFGYDERTGLGAAVNQDVLIRRYPDNAQVAIPSSNSVRGTIDRFRSGFFNGAYTYRRRYTISSSARMDQSNLFGVRTNQKTVPLWSVGVKWDISKEPFYNSGWIDGLRVKASYGYNGNMDNTLTAYTVARYATEFGSGIRFATVISLPNRHLRWERNSQFNTGLEFDGLYGFLEGSLEYFIRKGMDLIGDGPLDPTSGNSTYRGNLANMEGRGMDMALSAKAGKTGVKWVGDVFASFVTDKVTSYLAPQSDANFYLNDASLSGINISPVAGKPVFGIFSLPWAGLDGQTGAPMGYLGDVPSSDYTAMAQSRTLDGFVYHGRALPSWYGAFRNEIFYRDFSFSVNITYKLGHYFRRPSIRYDQLFAGGRSHGDYALRWQSPGDERITSIPSMVYPLVPGRDDFYANSAVLVQRASHVRLQDVQFSYRFSHRSARSMGLKHLTVYAFANNLGLLWKATGSDMDPDYAEGTFPPGRSVSLGIKTML